MLEKQSWQNRASVLICVAFGLTGTIFVFRYLLPILHGAHHPRLRGDPQAGQPQGSLVLEPHYSAEQSYFALHCCLV